MSENIFASSNYERSAADIDLIQYSYNLKKATKTDLHQDLLFYQMQLDSIERKLDSKLTLSDSSLKSIASKKISALNEEVERRVTEEFV
jgi:hypothetical protein